MSNNSHRRHVPCFLYIFFFIFILLTIITNVCATGKFTVHIYGFKNYRKARVDKRCCQDDKTGPSSLVCSRDCATKFRVCLTKFTSAEIHQGTVYRGNCSFGSMTTPQVGMSNFRYNEPLTVKLNIDQRWKRSFTLIMEAIDELEGGSRGDAIIDSIVYKGILAPRPRGNQHRIKYITKNGIEFDYKLKMECDENYYNVTCGTFCRPRNDIHGRYNCSDVGEKVCEPGWGGKDCNAPICKLGCHSVHGSCDEPGTCKCADGWQGPYCTQCIKYPGCKNGSCNNSPWSCKCFLNWGGRFCDKDLNYCGRHQPCKNKGICLPQDAGKNSLPYRCVCDVGYNGTNCENKMPFCLARPCRNGGNCTTDDTMGHPLEKQYYCNCPPGWTGRYCDENINACKPNTCYNGGTCVDQPGHNEFKCRCPKGWAGHSCQLSSQCSNTKCAHATGCVDLPNSDVQCECQPGWTGKFCDKNINDCHGQCKNGGKCKDLIDEFYCLCPEGFKGRYCETDVDECRLAIKNGKIPCQNNGICRDEPGGYRCDCPKDFAGKFCEIDKTPCDPNPCLNGAYCYNMGSDFYCKCNALHYGKRCESKRPSCDDGICEVVDPCTLPHPIRSYNNKSNSGVYRSPLSTICGERGRCQSLGGQNFRCDCDPGFTGKLCQENINECETKGNPCVNGGTCLDGINDFQCLCKDGYAGKRCEFNRNECIPNPCLNGGKCIDAENDFECDCRGTNYFGRWCHIQRTGRASPCGTHLQNYQEGTICLNGGTCHSENGQFQCSCKPDYSGNQCQINTRDYCREKEYPCQNGGTCVNIGNMGTTTCVCRGGYEGKYCEKEINKCHPNPCFNGGTCTNYMTAFECTCNKGFAGPDCRINLDDCASKPCSFGAECIDKINHYQCICPEGRKGEHCDEVIGAIMAKPPSCIHLRRIYDHGKSWTMNCKNCTCREGKLECKDAGCGHYSCKDAHERPEYACKAEESCVHIEIRRHSCFVEPCYSKHICRNKTFERSPKSQWATQIHLGCRPNSLTLNNRCARIRLTYNRMLLPYGVTVDDICQAIRNLKIVQSLHGQFSLGIHCDIQEYNRDIIEVAVGTESDYRDILDDSLEEYLKKRPTVHQLVDLIGKAIKMRESPEIVLRNVLRVQVETLLINTEDWEPTYLLPLLCVLVVLGIVLIVLIVLHHIREKKKILLKYAPYQKANNKPDSDNVQTGQVSRCRNILFPRSDSRGASSSRRSERSDSEAKEVRRPLKSGSGDRGIEISAPITHPPVSLPGTSNDSGIEPSYISSQRTSKQFVYGSRAPTSSKNVNVAQRMSGDYERGSPLVV